MVLNNHLVLFNFLNRWTKGILCKILSFLCHWFRFFISIFFVMGFQYGSLYNILCLFFHFHYDSFIFPFTFTIWKYFFSRYTIFSSLVKLDSSLYTILKDYNFRLKRFLYLIPFSYFCGKLRLGTTIINEYGSVYPAHLWFVWVIFISLWVKQMILNHKLW